MKIQVVSQVNIDITQEDLEEMIRAKILAHDPAILIRDINFVQRRKPEATIEVLVTAAYAADTPVDEPGESIIDAPEEEAEEAVLEEEDNFIIEPKTVAEIFNT